MQPNTENILSRLKGSNQSNPATWKSPHCEAWLDSCALLCSVTGRQELLAEARANKCQAHPKMWPLELVSDAPYSDLSWREGRSTPWSPYREMMVCTWANVLPWAKEGTTANEQLYPEKPKSSRTQAKNRGEWMTRGDPEELENEWPSKGAAQLDLKVSEWKSQLPAQFLIFQKKSEIWKFPMNYYEF